MSGHVLITGSARGIGYGMAREFLRRGWAVTLNGTNEKGLKAAQSNLRGATHSVVADVSRWEETEAMAESAEKAFGPIDIWVNNAGVPQKYGMLADSDPVLTRRVMDVNILGTVNGCRTAIRRMAARGSGRIFNMEGMGSDGMIRPGVILYGATKRAVRYLTRGLAREVSGGPVIVAALSPGIVITDFVVKNAPTDPAEYAQMKKVFDILADTVEPVAEFLVSKMVGPVKNGGRYAWLTGGKIATRFMFSPFRRREVFPPLK